MLGAYSEQNALNHWVVYTTWRHQVSDRHFRGSEEQVERKAEGSEVINTINMLELGLRYNFTPQWNLTLAVPYFSAERSSALRDANRVVVDRASVESNSVGDIVLTGRHLLFDPLTHRNGNVTLGLGIKAPTGDYDVYDSRERLVNGQRVFTDESVDQSIQPGDGGWGAVLDFQAFQRIRDTGGAVYGSASYLINPEGTNGVPTFRGNAGEEVMSISDQYVARAGFAYVGQSWKGFGFSLGGRIEGVPPEDLIGDSDGFRRPGFALSVEPGLSWAKGPHVFTASVPIAVHRDRQRSVPDRAVPGRHGDAAFADYIVMLGYFKSF